MLHLFKEAAIARCADTPPLVWLFETYIFCLSGLFWLDIYLSTFLFAKNIAVWWRALWVSGFSASPRPCWGSTRPFLCVLRQLYTPQIFKFVVSCVTKFRASGI